MAQQIRWMQQGHQGDAGGSAWGPPQRRSGAWLSLVLEWLAWRLLALGWLAWRWLVWPLAGFQV
jgi:hypothetical protein